MLQLQLLKQQLRVGLFRYLKKAFRCPSKLLSILLIIYTKYYGSLVCCYRWLLLVQQVGATVSSGSSRASTSTSSSIVVAVDGGTESIRACCFDENGYVVGSSCAVPYKTTHPFNAWAEQDPNDWYNCLGQAVRGALDSIGSGNHTDTTTTTITNPTSVSSSVLRGRVRAICVDTTCCSVVALDKNGTPLRPSLLWMDARSANETAIIMEKCRGDPALAINCDGEGPLSAEWLLPKALWIRNHEPKVWEEATMIGEYQDYINYKLTGGIFCASSCNAASRWHWNGDEALMESTQDNPYPGRPLSLYQSLGIPELAKKLPQKCHAMGEIIGPLCKDAAEHLTLPVGLPVVQGGPDAFVGMVGLGCINPGQLCLITGSSHLHCVVSSDASTSKGTWGAYKGAPLPGLNFAEGGQSSTGSILRWAKQQILNSNNRDDDDSSSLSYEILDTEAARLPPGAEGLVALETFQGSRTPETDPLARGALVGLTLSHTRAHIWRALLEAVCFGTRSCIEALSDAGHNCTEIVIAGGCTRSPFFLQMHGDVTGLPVLVRESTDAPLLGCAILAAVGSGMHKTVADAIMAMVRESRYIQPDPVAHEAYTLLYNRIYRKLSPSLRPIMHSLAELRGGDSPAGSSTISTSRSPFLVSGATTMSKAANEERLVLENRRRHHPMISPSLLACDWADIQGAVRRCENAGVSSIHVDVFDGVFLDSPYALTFGPQMVKAIRRSSASNVKLDIHICVERPERYVDAISEAGGDRFIFQFEAMRGDSNANKVDAALDLARSINKRGMKCGVSINPSTEASAIHTLLQSGRVDTINLLAVEPGFGGQKFQHHVIDKIQKLRRFLDRNGLDVVIMVDGGINTVTAKKVVEAGADVLTVGSYLFQHSESFENRLEELQLSIR